MLLATAAAAPAAAGGDGTAEFPEYGGAGYGELTASEEQIDRAVQKPGSGGRPLLSAFNVAGSRLYLYGPGTKVTYRIDDRAPTVRVSLRVIHTTTGKTVRAIRLGSQATGIDHSYRLTASGLRRAGYTVRVTASDPGGKRLTHRARVSARDEIAVFGHRFPLRGDFSYGDRSSRFGAPRRRRSHQGQDIAAPKGTPVLAPRGGRVMTVAYQRAGAGHYIVIDGAGENRTYVFMHLLDGSIRVRQGQRVRTGVRIASVGDSGASSGAHLHFEIWEGGWYADGKAVDPYDLLRSWDRWS